MGLTAEHPQLFNAGPVKIIVSTGRRHSAAIIPAQCAQILDDGTQCPNRKRRERGTKYCADHSRTNGYARQGEAPTIARVCHCGKEFTVVKTAAGPTHAAWREFCPSCHDDTPLSLDRLRTHKVPADLVRKWLLLRDNLACEVCGRRLNRRSRDALPFIDHDHSHGCGTTSCGECIRGILCGKCNTDLGHIETVRSTGRWDAMMTYIAKTPA